MSYSYLLTEFLGISTIMRTDAGQSGPGSISERSIFLEYRVREKACGRLEGWVHAEAQRSAEGAEKRDEWYADTKSREASKIFAHRKEICEENLDCVGGFGVGVRAEREGGSGEGSRDEGGSRGADRWDEEAGA